MDLLSIFLKILYIFIFRERGREEERERNINVWLPLTHLLLGTWHTTQACALTGNRTSNLLVCQPALSPLSCTSQGCRVILMETGHKGERFSLLCLFCLEGDSLFSQNLMPTESRCPGPASGPALALSHRAVGLGRGHTLRDGRARRHHKSEGKGLEIFPGVPVEMKNNRGI